MNNNRLIKAETTHSTIIFTIYSKQYGSEQYYVNADRLKHWYTSADSCSYTVKDSPNFIQFQHDAGDYVRMTLTNLHGYNGHFDAGHEYSVRIPTFQFLSILAGKNIRCVSYETPARNSHVILTFGAQEQIGRMIHRDPSMKHVISKAFSRNFCWYNTETTVYSDWGCDFYFKTDDGLAGGLIYSDYEDRRHHRVRHYSVHT